MFSMLLGLRHVRYHSLSGTLLATFSIHCLQTFLLSTRFNNVFKNSFRTFFNMYALSHFNKNCSSRTLQFLPWNIGLGWPHSGCHFLIAINASDYTSLCNITVPNDMHINCLYVSTANSRQQVSLVFWFGCPSIYPLAGLFIGCVLRWRHLLNACEVKAYLIGCWQKPWRRLFLAAYTLWAKPGCYCCSA